MERLSFNGYPTFQPHFTPTAMIYQGVFMGSFCYNTSRRYLLRYLDSIRDPEIIIGPGDPDKNKYKIEAPPRRKDTFIPNMIRMMDKSGWFAWYIKFSANNKGTQDKYRIEQWVKEITTCSWYLRKEMGIANISYSQLENMPIDDIPEKVRFWMQQLLQFGWEPTINPVGIVI